MHLQWLTVGDTSFLTRHLYMRHCMACSVALSIAWTSVVGIRERASRKGAAAREQINTNRERPESGTSGISISGGLRCSGVAASPRRSIFCASVVIFSRAMNRR